ncbi:unnamed protein product, partial [marine sediment metagenome]
MSKSINRIADLIAQEVAATDNLSQREQKELEDAIRRLLADIRSIDQNFDSQGDVIITNPTEVVGEWINKIIVYHADHDSAEFFPVNNPGLSQARNALRQYDEMFIPPAPENELTVDFDIPSTNAVNGFGTQSTYLHGKVTLHDNSFLRYVAVKRTANTSATLIGVVGPASGKAYFHAVAVTCDQNGSGDATGLDMGAGAMDIRE